MNRRRIRVVGAMVEKPGGRYLITQRSKTSSLPLLWEFPGGRVEEGESDEQALWRELQQDLGISVEVGSQAMHTTHAYPDYDIEFCVFRCTLAAPEGEVRHDRINDHRWVTLEEMGEYQFPDADARTIEKLLDLDH